MAVIKLLCYLRHPDPESGHMQVGLARSVAPQVHPVTIASSHTSREEGALYDPQQLCDTL
jgi:hypothetical protein